MAGIVGQMNGEKFSCVTRLEPDGGIDHSFHCDIVERKWRGALYGYGCCNRMAALSSGDFTQVNGPAQHLARLNPDGSLDPTFKLPFLPHEEFNHRRFLRVARLSKKPTEVAAAASSAATNTAWPRPTRPLWKPL